MPHEHTSPIVTVDTVLLTILDGELNVLLQKRSDDPFPGHWGLPGGFVHADGGQDSDVGEAARRSLLEKTGFSPAEGALEQLMTFSGPSRDPRGWSVSVAHLALVPHSAPTPPSGREKPAWVPVSRLPAKMAFDHSDIVEKAVERVRAKAGYSMIAAHLLPSEFTLGELQRIHEEIIGEKLDKSSFRKRMEESGLLVETGSVRQGPYRPAKLYSVSTSSPRFFKRSIS